MSKTYEPSNRHRGVALAWLFFALIMLVLTVLLWMFSAAPNMSHAISNEPVQSNEQIGQSIASVRQINVLDELSNDVQPISYDDIIQDLRDYPPEFQDKGYLNKHKNKWTVQVMNVAEHEVVTDYLKGRKDRDKFAYFRFLDTNNQARYMLTYGVMNSVQEAMGAAKLVDFGLPKNIRVMPEQMSRYLGIIDNYEKVQPMVDLNSNRPREVNLRATKKEVPVKPSHSNTESDINATQQGSLDNDSEGNTLTSNLAKNSASTAETPSIRTSDDKADTLSIKESRTVSDGTADTQSSSSKTDNSNAPANKSEKSTAKPNSSKPANESNDAKAKKETPTATNTPKPQPFDPNQFPNQKIVADGEMP